MKRILTYTAAIVLTLTAASSANRALYVKQADGVHRYSFGVAGNLKFDVPQNKMMISGYESAIMLDQVEYMTFDLPVEGQLTPNDQKDKLILIGEELNSKIDANKCADLLGFSAEWDNLYGYDDSAIFEDFRNAHPDLFEEDDDYYRSNIKVLVKAIEGLSNGDYAAARTVGKVYTELFRRSDFTGVFTANPDTKKWEKTANADYFEINFAGPAKGKSYSLRIDMSDEYTEWSDAIIIKNVDGSTSTYNVTGQAPSQISGVVKVDGKEVFNSSLFVTLDKNKKAIDIRTVSEAADARVEDVISIRDNSASANLTVWLKGEKAITNQVNLTGSHLLNVAEWCEDFQAILDEYEAENWGYYYYDMDGRKIARKFGAVSTHTDILGKLQIRGHVANYDKSYDDLDTYISNNDEDRDKVIDHEKRIIYYYYGWESWMDKIADVINNYTDASFYYDGSDSMQGFLTWNTYEDVDDYGYTTSGYWDDETDQYVELDGEYKVVYIDYYLMPYLTFSDGTTFAFDSDYFTGGNFKKLVNDAEDIADIINNILSDYDYDCDDYDY